PLEAIPLNTITTEGFAPGQLPAKDLPPAAVTIDVTPIESKPESDRGINTQDANTAGSNNTLNNNLLLLVYQLACPPQIVNSLAQLQRKHPKRKRDKRKRHKRRQASLVSQQKQLRERTGSIGQCPLENAWDHWITDLPLAVDETALAAELAQMPSLGQVEESAEKTNLIPIGGKNYD
ncbi:MAG: hypothetical protein AAFW84_35000, partial [Cyanobacteria bacterium J06635_15]